jgi:hypothetical protein
MPLSLPLPLFQECKRNQSFLIFSDLYSPSQKKAIDTKDVNLPMARSIPVGVKRRVNRKSDSLVEYYHQFSTEQSKKEKNGLYSGYLGLKDIDPATLQKNSKCYKDSLNFTPTVSLPDQELYKLSLNVDADGRRMAKSKNAVFIV